MVKAKKLGHNKELKLSDDFYEYFHLQKKQGKVTGIEKNVEKEGEREGEKEITKAEQIEENHNL